MSIESLIEDSGQQATVTSEAPDGQVPAQDPLGGADRSDGNWVTVADGVPCLVRSRTAAMQAWPGRDDARRQLWDTRIYFTADPVPNGIGSRHRVTVVMQGVGGPKVLGVYAVTGSIDPNTMGRLFEVDCERIKDS